MNTGQRVKRQQSSDTYRANPVYAASIDSHVPNRHVQGSLASARHLDVVKRLLNSVIRIYSSLPRIVWTYRVVLTEIYVA